MKATFKDFERIDKLGEKLGVSLTDFKARLSWRRQVFAALKEAGVANAWSVDIETMESIVLKHLN